MVCSMSINFSFSWWISNMCVIYASDRTLFNRDLHYDNKRFCEATSNVLTSVSLDQCAGHCHNTSSCYTLAYNRKDGICQLFSQIYIGTEDTISEDGNLVFRKQNDEAICPVPMTIPKGKVLFTDGLVSGSVAEFVCDDFHFPTTEAGVCDPSGTWVGFDNPCQQKPSGYYYIPAVGKVETGSCLVVHATPTANTKFRFILWKQSSDYNFLFTVRLSDRVLVRNSKIDNKFGRAETNTPFFPFVLNQEFNLTVCAEKTLYRVYIDSAETFTYNYRRPISEITAAVLDNAVTLRRIRFYNWRKYGC